MADKREIQRTRKKLLRLSDKESSLEEDLRHVRSDLADAQAKLLLLLGWEELPRLFGFRGNRLFTTDRTLKGHRYKRSYSVKEALRVQRLFEDEEKAKQRRRETRERNLAVRNLAARMAHEEKPTKQ